MPAKNAGGTGGATESLAQTRPHVDHSAFSRHHILTDGQGRYTALLCRQTGRLQRLPRGVEA